MKKRAIYTAVGIAALFAGGFAAVKAIMGFYSPGAVTSESYTAVETATPTALPTQPPEPEETSEPTPEPTPTPEPYISPIDFETLQQTNSDIYAWLRIDDTNIDFPVVQSQTDDTYYLNHNSDGKYAAAGSIFSEHEFNTNDFTDPVTILYGHHQWDGAMFGRLQQYFTDESFWSADHTLKVYTPDGFLEFGVFAAIPYSSQHILYYNDFTDPDVFETFFDSVFNVRELGARFNEDYAPEAGDRVLILSTCLISNNTRRFLVMAKLLA